MHNSIVAQLCKRKSESALLYLSCQIKISSLLLDSLLLFHLNQRSNFLSCLLSELLPVSCNVFSVVSEPIVFIALIFLFAYDWLSRLLNMFAFIPVSII